jgi:hypothetical protein
MEEYFCIVCGEPTENESEIYCIYHEDFDPRTTEEIFTGVEATIAKVISA